MPEVTDAEVVSMVEVMNPPLARVVRRALEATKMLSAEDDGMMGPVL